MRIIKRNERPQFDPFPIPTERHNQSVNHVKWAIGFRDRFAQLIWTRGNERTNDTIDLALNFLRSAHQFVAGSSSDCFCCCMRSASRKNLYVSSTDARALQVPEPR
ncbi:MAG: hypothetical protein ABSE40_19435 [Candidatus Sulfotelmatobacter sp.]